MCPVCCADPGQLLQACVLDLDKVKGVVDLSLKPTLTHAAAAASSSGKKSSKKHKQQQQQGLPDVGTETKAVVLEVKEHHIVVALQQQQQQQQDSQAVLQEQQQNGTVDKKSSKKAAKAAATAAGDAAAFQQQQQQQLVLGFVARGDFHSQLPTSKDYLRFKHDQALMVRVVAHPSQSNGMKLLLEVRGGCVRGAGGG
jgi:ribosomal protein S1